jgi:hypothetical protein
MVFPLPLGLVHRVLQGAPASAARLDPVVDDLVRLGHEAQRGSSMSGLASRAATARFSQALGRRPHHVGGRRLGGILGVLVQARLQFADPPFRLAQPFLELAKLTFKRGDPLFPGGVQISVSPLHPSV